MFKTSGKKVFEKVIAQYQSVPETIEKNLAKVADQIKTRANFYVPYQTGATHDSAYTEVNVEGNTITGIIGYDVEKAIELRYNRTGEIPADNYVVINHEDISANFNTSINPNATGQWLLKAFKEYESKIKEELIK